MLVSPDTATAHVPFHRLAKIKLSLTLEPQPCAAAPCCATLSKSTWFVKSGSSPGKQLYVPKGPSWDSQEAKKFACMGMISSSSVQHMQQAPNFISDFSPTHTHAHTHHGDRPLAPAPLPPQAGLSWPSDRPSEWCPKELRGSWPRPTDFLCFWNKPRGEGQENGRKTSSRTPKPGPLQGLVC